MSKQLDRRVVRTRRRLKAAVLELVRTRPYDSITVQEIIDRADVGRSTFYAHFGSKEELLLDGFREVLLSLGRGEESAFFGSGERFGFSRPLLRHFRAQRRFFLATMTGGSNARIRKTFEGWLAERIEEELAEKTPAAGSAEGGGGSVPFRVGRSGPGTGSAVSLRARGIAAAFLGIADQWLAQGEDMNVEEVDAVFRSTVVL